MQQCSRWFYDKAVSRCQVSLNTEPPIFFFRDRGFKGAKNEIFMLDISALKLHKRILSMDMGVRDFNLQVISFRRNAFVTGGEDTPQRCIRLSYAHGNSKDLAKQIKCQKIHDMLHRHKNHSVCKFLNRYLVVSGGVGQKRVEYLDTAKEYFNSTVQPWQPLGELADQRNGHASVGTTSSIFIFFGFNTRSTRALGSIEEKDMRGLERNECQLRPWTKI